MYDKNLIALDLELEQPKTRTDTQDSMLDKERIIQVGYVIFSVEPEYKIIKQYSKHVNIGVPLSKFIQKLTGIKNEDIQNGTTLKEIYNDFWKDSEDYNCSRIVRQWGGGDMECFQREMEEFHPEVKWQFGRSGYNVKHLFQTYRQANNQKWQGGLKNSMKKISLSWEGGKAHDAMVDALNTAKMYNFLYGKLKNNV